VDQVVAVEDLVEVELELEDIVLHFQEELKFQYYQDQLQ
jgi:hypothetical protein